MKGIFLFRFLCSLDHHIEMGLGLHDVGETEVHFGY
jgi:hypothetical protein